MDSTNVVGCSEGFDWSASASASAPAFETFNKQTMNHASLTLNFVQQ
jgi:hypothetical protein